jgi:hypothetical protein
LNYSTLPADYQRQRDRDHLNLLSIFHFVVSGLSLLGTGFLCLHYLIMSTVFSNPEMWKNQKTAPPFNPEQFMNMFVWFYLFMGVLLVAACVLNLLSGLFLRQRKHRIFSLVVAGLDCFQIPFGTVLGVFTFVVLLRDSVQEEYRLTAPAG